MFCIPEFHARYLIKLPNFPLYFLPLSLLYICLIFPHFPCSYFSPLHFPHVCFFLSLSSFPLSCCPVFSSYVSSLFSFYLPFSFSFTLCFIRLFLVPMFLLHSPSPIFLLCFLLSSFSFLLLFFGLFVLLLILSLPQLMFLAIQLYSLIPSFTFLCSFSSYIIFCTSLLY